MNKNSILAILSVAMVGCAHKPISMNLPSSDTNSQAQIDTRPLGNYLTVSFDSFNVLSPVDLKFIIDDQFGQRLSSGIQATHSLDVELLFMNVDVYSSLKTYKSNCDVAYNVNGRGKRSQYSFESEYDFAESNHPQVVRLAIAPCLDSLAKDIQEQADSL
ncbi:hypothetical protein ACF8PD_18185 [Vibrio plantisponsor]|uniref:hypothetical protein n=1 Tax=Vibrio plantisponsor TaxID=664643 RepID=UPI00370B39C7